MEPIKVVFLTTGLNPGGAETQLVNLAVRLQQRGWDTRVISMLPDGVFTLELNRANIPLYSLKMKRGLPDPRSLFRLVRLLNRIQPQIVHSHMVHANILARLSRLFVRVPVLISTAHNINEGPRWRELAYRFTDSLADLTTNVSRAGVERYVKVGAAPESKIRFMPNGVDTVTYCPQPEIRERMRQNLELKDDFLWLAAGRFVPPKNYPLMIRSFTKMASIRSSTRLIIAGDGPDLAGARILARDLGIASKVKFLGYRSDIPLLMNAADAFISSSTFEGMPLAILEASACGLPVVATDAGGIPEIVADGEAGFIIRSGDPDALATAMIKMMTMTEAARIRMGMNGRESVIANFSLDRVATLWEDLYYRQLQQKGFHHEDSFHHYPGR